MPALKQNKIVLCDRFSDATLAYQGFGRGLSLEFIKSLNEFSAAPLKPDLTLLFDLPVEVGLGRAIDRIAHIQGAPREDRFEQEDRAFHQKIRIGYLSLARNEPGRIRMIDASRDVQTIGQEVCAMIWTAIKQP